MNSKPLISRVEKNDIIYIKEIEKLCSLSSWTAEDYLKATKDLFAVFLKAEFENKIIGYVLSRLIMNKKSDHNIIVYDLEILNIGVIPEFRRKNTGKSLIRFILSETNYNIENVWLEVRESNVSAVKFYERLGFKITQRRKGLYGNPFEDGFVMNLSLKC